MNCEKCQKLLSDYIDGTLGSADRALISKHLDVCLDCGGAHEELRMIVGAARECREELFSPPDSRAMWLRISNTIEGERAFTRPADSAPPQTRGLGFWPRLLNRRWQLTLPQMAAAVSAIAVGAALLTVLAVQSLDDARITQNQTVGVAERASEDSYPNRYLRQQNARLSYLQQRVEQRKASWNPRVRESFERSLGVIDQTVVDSLDDLKRNPHDEVSEEMLNSAVRDKMELLREFSEQ
jgi:hypothetical protein